MFACSATLCKTLTVDRNPLKTAIRSLFCSFSVPWQAALLCERFLCGADASNSDYYSAVYANTAAATGGAAAPAVGQVNIKPANKAPSQLNPGVLQRPGATDTSSANSLTAATPATTDSAGSATAAQDILSSLSGNLADSPGVSPAPQGSVSP